MSRPAHLVRLLPRAYTLFDRLLALADRLAALFRGRRADRLVRLHLEAVEPRIVPTGRPLPSPVIFVGAGDGSPAVTAYAADTGATIFSETVFDTSFTGGVRVAVADFTGDGYPDAVVAAGPGGGPEVRILDGHTGDQISGPLGSFFAFDEEFTGGVNVAAADVDGDGVPDVVAAAGPGGGPHVRVFSGATGEELASFFAYDPAFDGGISVASADLTGDGKAEVAVGAGEGGGPQVTVYDLTTGEPIDGPLGSFFAFDSDFRGGVYLGADALTGDLDHDGTLDLAVGSGPGMAGEVKVYSGATGDVLRDLTPFGSSFEGGVRPGLAYVNDDEFADVVVGTGPGATDTVRVFDGATGDQLSGGDVGEYAPFGTRDGGVFVAASNDPVFPMPGDPTSDGGWTDAVTGRLDLAPGQTLSVTASFHAPAPGTGPTPTGSITFFFQAAAGSPDYPIGTVAMTGGSASVTTNKLPAAFGDYEVWMQYNPDGDPNYSATLSNLTVPFTIIDPVEPVGCGCGDAFVNAAGDDVAPPAIGTGGVRVADGVVRVDEDDLTADGFGQPWDQTDAWTNVPAGGDGVSGAGWTQAGLPRVYQTNGDSFIDLVTDSSAPHMFDYYGGAYHPLFSAAATLTHSGGQFVATDGAGDTFTFYDFSGGTPTGRGGRLISMVTAAGVPTDVVGWDVDGRPLEVDRTSGSGTVLRAERFVSTYVSGGENDGLLASVTREVKVGSAGSYAAVRSVEYTYYESTDTYGTTGQLMTAAIKDGSGAVIDTNYYRYYPGTSGGGSGSGSGSGPVVPGPMEYAFGPAAYARLIAALGTGVDALTDTQVAPYADTYLEYDAAGRVATRVAAGAGCSACSGGQGEYTYTYTANPDPVQFLPNAWTTETVETLPDGNTNTYYTNGAGQQMLKVYEDQTTHAQWLWYTRYDAAGRVVLTADPSAVTGYDDTDADLVDYGGVGAYLSASAGLISTTTYATTTTATTSTAGDVLGFVSATAIQQGTGGTPVPQSAQTYIESPAGTFAPAGSTVYRNDNGTGGETTTATYTWQGSTAQPAAVTVTLPTVTTAQNGPNSATSMTTVYDAFGRPEWAKDAGGFLTYTAFDTLTGAVVKTIQDVNTGGSGFADLPSGWTTPSGGGLHLTTTYEVDGLGRATKVSHPDGQVDYTVYDDADHEVRYYPGWNGTTHLPTGPTTVTREDRAGNYTETLTMTAAPHLTGSNLPDGTESIAQVQSLSRQYRNDAGQAVTSDTYFDPSGLTYSTSTSLGTSGVNFYRTTYAYDHQGRQNKVVSPQGTIARIEYDGLGRAVSEWVGTDDTPTTGYWSPTNLTGTDMVKVREYEYDGGGVGDGNLTQVTDIPGLSAADRVTRTVYDWRDRAVATKSGVEGSESTAVNRPIVFTDYDNLGEVTKTQVYDGDTVTPSTTAPSSSLLRAQTTTSYDELGRAYRQDTYDVDPSSGSVGSDTLYALTWYDSRGEVIKTLAPGGLVQKASYDGAGRTTASYATDGGGDSGYADADDVSGDAVLEQAESAYDADGKVLTITTRQRFHDETSTGALGTPSSGVRARVSYVGYYYDLGGRPTAVLDVGTNGGSSWTLPGSVPSRSDTELVTSYAYAADAVQTVKLTGSPTGGTFTLTFGGYTTSGIAYNASATTVQTALQGLTSVGSGNAIVTAATGGGWQVRFAGTLAGKWKAKITASGASLTGGTSPAAAVSTVSAGGDAGAVAAVTDPKGLVSRTYADTLGRTTQTVQDFTDGAVTDTSNKTTLYTYNGTGMTSLTAALTGGGGQTTAYVYGVTTGSAIASNDAVSATEWPDPSTGAASTSEKDVVTVNALGEPVTSTDRNGSVHTLTYDVLGRVTADAVTTLGSGVDGAVRRIETAYDGQGNPYLVTSYDAASSGSVVNQVQRAYNGLGQLTTEWQAHGGAVNTSTSPKVQYAYDEMPSGADESRLTSITYTSGYVLTYTYSSGLNSSISRLSSLSDSTGTLEAYSYLGLGTVVIRSHPQPTIDLTFVKQGLESVGDAGDQYTGLDRFGRVADQRWINTTSGTATDRFQSGYDRDGNVLDRDNLVSSGFGEVYAYDDLNQLASFARGTLNGTKTGITGMVARSQGWDYDAAGNFDSVTTNGGSPVTRSANAQNEITAIGGATTPTYDAAGNMTGDETGRTFVYDAWNRLVAVKSGATTLETFGYDGLNRRVTNTVGGTTTDLFYSAQWQVLEEKIGSSTTTRYVWSPVYVDAMVLRDRDTDANGTLDERLWVQQDANWNVTAVLDGSGAVQERYVYDPYGVQTIYSGNYGTVRSSSLYSVMVGFQGMQYDSISGLNFTFFRPYSSTLGRPISADPLGFIAGDVNFYRWEENGPANSVDPSGLLENPLNCPPQLRPQTLPQTSPQLSPRFPVPPIGPLVFFWLGYQGMRRLPQPKPTPGVTMDDPRLHPPYPRLREYPVTPKPHSPIPPQPSLTPEVPGFQEYIKKAEEIDRQNQERIDALRRLVESLEKEAPYPREVVPQPHPGDPPRIPDADPYNWRKGCEEFAKFYMISEGGWMSNYRGRVHYYFALSECMCETTHDPAWCSAFEYYGQLMRHHGWGGVS